MSGYTKGPWQWDKDGDLVDARGEAIFSASGGWDGLWEIEVPNDADKPVLAAAPELLEACKAAERVMVDADLDHEPSDDPARVALEAIRAAILKAEGR